MQNRYMVCIRVRVYGRSTTRTGYKYLYNILKASGSTQLLHVFSSIFPSSVSLLVRRVWTGIDAKNTRENFYTLQFKPYVHTYVWGTLPRSTTSALESGSYAVIMRNLIGATET